LLNDCAGHTAGVQASDIVTTPVRLGAAIRRRRLFHPVGVVAEGILERVAPSNEGLPMASCDVINRVSKDIGLRGALPDIAGGRRAHATSAGFAWCTPWDVLLASTVGSSIGRLILPRPFLVVGHHILEPDAVALPGWRGGCGPGCPPSSDTPGLSLATVVDNRLQAESSFDINKPQAEATSCHSPG
jgi:hypothetical protein